MGGRPVGYLQAQQHQITGLSLKVGRGLGDWDGDVVRRDVGLGDAGTWDAETRERGTRGRGVAGTASIFSTLA